MNNDDLLELGYLLSKLTTHCYRFSVVIAGVKVQNRITDNNSQYYWYNRLNQATADARMRLHPDAKMEFKMDITSPSEAKIHVSVKWTYSHGGRYIFEVVPHGRKDVCKQTEFIRLDKNAYNEMYETIQQPNFPAP